MHPRESLATVDLSLRSSSISIATGDIGVAEKTAALDGGGYALRDHAFP
jgi:hypothetical protein